MYVEKDRPRVANGWIDQLIVRVRVYNCPATQGLMLLELGAQNTLIEIEDQL